MFSDPRFLSRMTRPGVNAQMVAISGGIVRFGPFTGALVPIVDAAGANDLIQIEAFQLSDLLLFSKVKIKINSIAQTWRRVGWT